MSLMLIVYPNEKTSMDKVAKIHAQKLVSTHNVFTKQNIVDMEDLETDEEYEETLSIEKENVKCAI